MQAPCTFCCTRAALHAIPAHASQSAEPENCLCACVGYVCAMFFPRCFYVNATHQGGFVFEECRQTCEVCRLLQLTTCNRVCRPSLSRRQTAILSR